MPSKDPWGGPQAPETIIEPAQPLSAEGFFKVLNAYYRNDGEMSVEQPSTLRIRDWRLFRADGADHLVGWIDSLEVAWVSSAILEVSIDGRNVRTESNRIYLLEGPSGYCHRAELEFLTWQGRWKPSEVVNVTHDYDVHQRSVAATSGNAFAIGSDETAKVVRLNRYAVQ